MASIFESIQTMPVWQRLVAWLVVGMAIMTLWYFLFYIDAVQAREGAEASLAQAKIELGRLETKKKNYLEELRQHEERKAKTRETLEIVPMSSSTVDNLMQIFQQKARQVGMSFDSWNNEAEQRADVYARLPVTVKAEGTWVQVGEFFRQLAEYRQPLSIENIQLERLDSRAGLSEANRLRIEFEAATYRALSEQERVAPTTKRSGARRRSRRSGT